MAETKPRISRAPYLWLLATAAAAYLLVTLLTPVTATDRFNIPESKLRLLQLTVILPVMLTWIAGTVGAYRIREYAATLGNTADGRNYCLLARGVLIIVVGTVLSGLIGAFRPYFGEDIGLYALIQMG